MKILTLCEGGLVRSVSAAALLKFEHGHDAIAASLKYNSPETLTQLYDWADRVIVMDVALIDQVPVMEKRMLWNVGRDCWGAALHPELMELIRQYIATSDLARSA